MCGIAGYWSSATTGDDRSIIDAMTDELAHRGPDGRGVWVDRSSGLALGHRRLAIVDLSEAGAQPMRSHHGRYVAAYNGELYNFAELRRQVQLRDPAYEFRGDSDTEVLLGAVETFGLDRTLELANGMFAIALWDRRRRRLTLVRDRLGIKPLYYGRAGDALVFGSELNALRRHPDFHGSVDRQALADLLRLNSIPAPRSIFRDVHKLEPGTAVEFNAPDHDGRTRHYWSAAAVASRGLADPFEGTPAEAVDLLESHLREAVGARMVADVPLGAFLSGGVDSSTVVAIMQSLSSRPVKTFSIGYHDGAFNEAGHAKKVADHLGTDHRELYLTSDDVRAVIPRLPRLFDEPFADSSQLPTYLVSELARGDVTVALSGDGGDELFAGYNRHVWASRVQLALRAVPTPVRAALAAAMLLPAPARVDALYERIKPILPGPARVRMPAEKLQKLAHLLAIGGADHAYQSLRAHWREPKNLVVGLSEDRPRKHAPPVGANFTERLMFLDLVSYLPDDILTKVDRASMAVGLEARVPLLDHRLVDFAWSLPLDLKLRGNSSKWLLRQVLYRHVPRRLIERPKMGFGVPIGNWLRGPLRDWAEDLLSPTRLRRQGFFHVDPVRRVWRQHLDGRANREHELWNLLIFQSWLGLP